MSGFRFHYGITASPISLALADFQQDSHDIIQALNKVDELGKFKQNEIKAVKALFPQLEQGIQKITSLLNATTVPNENILLKLCTQIQVILNRINGEIQLILLTGRYTPNVVELEPFLNHLHIDTDALVRTVGIILGFVAQILSKTIISTGAPRPKRPLR